MKTLLNKKLPKMFGKCRHVFLKQWHSLSQNDHPVCQTTSKKSDANRKKRKRKRKGKRVLGRKNKRTKGETNERTNEQINKRKNEQQNK